MKQVIRSLFVVIVIVSQLTACNNNPEANTTKDTVQSKNTEQASLQKPLIKKIKTTEVADAMVNMGEDGKNFVPSSCMTISDLNRLTKAANKNGSKVIRFSIVQDVDGKNGIVVNFYTPTDSARRPNSSLSQLTVTNGLEVSLNNSNCYFLNVGLRKNKTGSLSNRIVVLSSMSDSTVCCPPVPGCPPRRDSLTAFIFEGEDH